MVESGTGNPYSLERLIEETRRLAREYRRTTGKPLPGVTGEIANFDATRLLGLDPVTDTTGGYDAVGREGPMAGKRVQIKGRAVFDSQRGNQRIGQLKLDKAWDLLALVLLDDAFEAEEIWLAERTTLEQDLRAKSSDRGGKGALSLARFRHLGRAVWTRDDGVLNGVADGSGPAR